MGKTEPDNSVASTSTTFDDTKGHHRRTSSLWVPPSRSIFSSPTQVIREKAENGERILKTHPVTRWLFRNRPVLPQQRIVVPNNQPEPPPRYEHPNRKYNDNRISTTKYSILTFIPRNLFEQMHRAANLYFIFIVVLNMIIGAFGKYISMMPISFVLGITAIKDAFENILVGDFVHLSHDEIIPADMLLLRSSDPNGVCYVETSNLDGESNLKQRQAIRAMGKYHNANVPQDFCPDDFKYRVACELPTTDVYKFEGRLEAVEGGPPIAREFTILAKENVLLRGCVVRNTDFVEGIVLYAGPDTKAMLNNGGPRYKRSTLEKLTNIDIIWCVVILLALCITAAILTGVFLRGFDDPYAVPFLTYFQDFVKDPINKPNKTTSEYSYRPSFESWWNFWSYVIVLQVLIPISLYVSIEFIKLGQVWLMSQDKDMYYDKVDKRLQCRALNITEELGQIQYVMSDKTGTLTENQMVFRRCSVAGRDYGGRPVSDVGSSLALVASNLAKDDEKSKSRRQMAALAAAAATASTGRPRPSRDPALETQLSAKVRDANFDDPVFAFFLTMAICNTVVVNAKPHEDLMDPDGDIINSRFDFDDSDESSSGSNNSSAQHLEEVEEEESSSSASSPTNSPVEGEERPQKKADDGFEDIELIQFPEEKKASDDEVEKDEEPEPKKDKEFKGLQSILHRPSILSLGPLVKLKGIKSPFRRSVDKRHSTSSVAPPPIHSFYDSESPDELALVEAAREYGVRLLKRRFDEVIIYLRHSTQSMKFKVLHTLPFDADRKRMSVVVRECTGKRRVMLLTKGADASILPVLSQEFCSSGEGEEIIFQSQEHLSKYAKEGLRTLCLSRKIWSEEEYQAWRTQHEEAELDPHHSENLLQDSTMKAEMNLELLGVTAIEDRLQDGVPECIHSLREAGIRVWVLTGDKVETAVNIAYSSRLFSPSMDLLNIGANGVRGVSDLIDEHLKRIARAREVTDYAGDSFGLVLNAATMNYCTDPHNIDRFVSLLRQCRSVLCCRATPLQKAELVSLAKHRLHGKVLAIGDGANDVSMIQGADVGVGLSGQEGMQAVMASDFAMARFRFLAKLLLVHGHWCYYRLAQTILYFFYKNAMLVFVIFWYQIFNGFSAQVPIDPVYLMVYNLIFTSVPPLLFGCTDQDASSEILLEYPRLYEQGRLGKRYRWYSFWMNMVDSLYQSAVVYWICHFAYAGTDCDMWMFGNLLITQLMLVNTAHLALLVQYWTWPMFWSMALSVVSFFLCALLYNGFVTPNWTWTNVKDPPVLIAEKALSDCRFWVSLLLSVVLSLVPRFVLTSMVNTLTPSTILRRRIAAKQAEKKRASGMTSCLVNCVLTPVRCGRVVCCCGSQNHRISDQTIHVP
ncbi:unnamed protein product [Caenorhabditis auriculariae]|uniref:Phospholipid-transporting ATPase n=1 Tax=Caenorhabditis auriculariae TaxID=2777116 RepID=A0A8S1GPN0_9PELO|nr:unnamed protein product [Caenorhabditis auriculariae]